MSNNKIWFVTGASKGLGLSLVKQLLQQGYKVAATSRSLSDLQKAVPQQDAFLPLSVDLTSGDSVRTAIDKTVAYFGGIDIVVNNAGYGLVGALEELSDEEARENFNVNVFGTLHVIREVMPHLRKQRSGHIFNIASIGGFFGNFPGWGIYCATKFAVVGLTEALSAEVKDFGVKVTVVEPGYFRTEFLAAGSIATPKQPIAEYTAVRESQDVHQHSMNGNQAGDPEKAVAAIINIADEDNPPLHLFLGKDAYQMAYDKIAAVETDLETWKQVTVSTSFND